jgi:hypothetical protein
MALPFLFLALARLLPAAGMMPVYTGPGTATGAANTDQSGFSASWMLLSLNPSPLNSVSDQIGFPETGGGGMSLYGGGAMMQSGAARFGVMGWTGGLSNSNDGNYSNWGLDIAGLLAEQRYSAGPIDILGGVFAGVGQYSVEYRNSSSLTRFESRFLASGITAGVHYPVSSRLSFLLRSGYFWLPATGAWEGSYSSVLSSSSYFDLSAPFVEAELNLAI